MFWFNLVAALLRSRAGIRLLINGPCLGNMCQIPKYVRLMSSERPK